MTYLLVFPVMIVHVQVAEKPKPEPKKLSAIVKKLWQVLKVNKLLLAGAIVTMVSIFPINSTGALQFASRCY